MGNFDTPSQGPGGSRENAVLELKKKLAGTARPAWIPGVSGSDGAPSDSKFSGKPVLKKDESWPLCENCGKPLQLFLQLNISQLPAEANVKGKGYLQMFYCTSNEPHCEVDCQAFFPFSKSTLLRIVNEADATGDYNMPTIEGYFPASTIEHWDQVTDYPGYEERSELQHTELTQDEEELADDNGISPRPGDKLGGWPMWIQGVEYPSCPDCGSQMELVFQLDSEINISYMWGDCGAGHITQCKTHPHRLAFGWACY